MDTDASYHRGRAKHPFYTYLPTTCCHRIRVHMRQYTCDICKYMRAGGSHDDPDGSHDRPSATGHGTAGLSTGGDHRPLRLGPDDDMLSTGQMAALNGRCDRPMRHDAKRARNAAPNLAARERSSSEGSQVTTGSGVTVSIPLSRFLQRL